MKIATYNVNGVNGRLPVLLRWLHETAPDVVCLQELKAPQEKFPEAAIEKEGYRAIWHGQKSWNGVAILARGIKPVEIRRGLPGEDEDTHSRYIEATVGDLVIGCLYLPNGNPAPGPKFDYKLRWFERLTAHAAKLLGSGAPVILAGDYNVMPTDLDVYKPERWLDDALFRPEVREAYRRLVLQGWTDSLRTLHPKERIYTFWDYFRNAYGRDAGLRIDHLLLSQAVAARLQTAGVDRQVRGWEKTSDHAPTWIELADDAHIGKVQTARKKKSRERVTFTRASAHDEELLRRQWTIAVHCPPYCSEPQRSTAGSAPAHFQPASWRQISVAYHWRETAGAVPSSTENRIRRQIASGESIKRTTRTDPCSLPSGMSCSIRQGASAPGARSPAAAAIASCSARWRRRP